MLKKICFILFLAATCSIHAQEKNPGTHTKSMAKNAGTYTCKIIPALNQTWGYDILTGKIVVIHQPTIPGQPGQEGFKTKSKAEKIAKLVISKLKRGEMPPTISTDELKKYKAL